MRTTKTITGRRPYSPFWRLVSVIVLVPLLSLLIRGKREGQDNVPGEGGVIFAANHLSYADWAPDALFCHSCGRYPTFLIKASAFEVKGVGTLLRKTGQLPVHRGRADAALALRQAEKLLAEGAAVVIYPEGTATRDPGLWPMAAKTGVARLALATGVPVIPVARWGTHDILPYGASKPRLFPRKTVRTVAGRPVDLSQWAGQHNSATALRAATEAIMAEVTALVGQLRGQAPPAVPYDPRSLASRTGSAACDAPAVAPSPGAAPLTQAAPESDGLIAVESKFSVSETIDRLAAGAAQAGLLVFARIDHAQGARDAGLELRPTQLLIFGHPRGGTPLMLDVRQAGIDLPFRALSWQGEDGRVWLAWNDAEWLARRHGLGAGSAPAVQAISTGAGDLAMTAAGLSQA